MDALDAKIDPLGLKGVRFIHPFYPTARMTLQSAVFTIHAIPWDDLRIIVAQNDCDVIRLEQHRIARNCKGEILKELQ